MITATFKKETAFLYKDVDPQLVAKELLEIGEDFTPEQIVDKARDINTELHRCFEWNDTVAAEKYRKHQARQLCCNLLIQKDENKEDVHGELRFVYNNDGKSYKPSTLIFNRMDEYEKLLKTAQGELHAFKLKYAFLKELNPILDMIN